MSHPNPSDGLPLLADPRLHIHLSRVDQQKAVVRLYFNDVFIQEERIDEAKWIFLSELIQAARAADGRPPELAFLTTEHLVKAVRDRSDAEFSRQYRTMSELRGILAKPFLQRKLCRDLSDGLPLKERIIEHKDGLGYRLGLPAANLSLAILRRDPAHETWHTARDALERESRRE